MDTEFALECQKSKNKELTPRILVLIVFSCFLFFLNVSDFTMYTVFVFFFRCCFVLFRFVFSTWFTAVIKGRII